MTRNTLPGAGVITLSALVGVGLIALGVRSFVIVDPTGPVPTLGFIVALFLGVWLPLAAVIYAVSRRRVVVIALAFCVGLSTNLVFLAHAVPAAAVTDNSSVFMFKRTTAYNPPSPDMEQNYTPTGAATTCTGATGWNWTCSWTSDTFGAGHTIEAGTAEVDLYVANTNPLPSLRFASNLAGGSNNVCTLNKPAALANGDVMLAACSFRIDTPTTVTSVPSGWTIVGSRIDNAPVALVVYSHVVTDAASEPASYSWSLSQVVKHGLSLVVYTGIDPTNPIDADDGVATASGSSHVAPSLTTSVSNDVLVAYFSTATCTFWTPPAGMTERSDTNFCSQGAGTNTDMETSDEFLGAAGATGTRTATNDAAAVGVNKIVALRRNTAPVTCDLTVQLTKPIVYRTSSWNIAEASTTITVNKPAGLVDGDVMIAALESNNASFVAPTGVPSGWNVVRHQGASDTYWKLASSEPASYTWTYGASGNNVAAIIAYSGVDPSNPIDVSAAQSGSFPTVMPSLTTTQPGDMLLVAWAGWTTTGSSPASWTPLPGMVEREDHSTTAAASWVNLALHEQLWPIAGATGTRTNNSSPTLNSGVSQWLALRPAAGAFLGSGTASITSPSGPTLRTVSIATPAVTFAGGERLQVSVIVPNDNVNCGASISYDGASEPSKLTLATVVPEGVAGLLLLAPALPLALRKWRGRRQ